MAFLKGFNGPKPSKTVINTGFKVWEGPPIKKTKKPIEKWAFLCLKFVETPL
jgi:hypothetical protein